MIVLSQSHYYIQKSLNEQEEIQETLYTAQQTDVNKQVLPTMSNTCYIPCHLCHAHHICHIYHRHIT